MGDVGGALGVFRMFVFLLAEKGKGWRAASNSCHCLLPAERPVPRNRGAEARQTDAQTDGKRRTRWPLDPASSPFSLPPAPGG